ncbi:SbcC/MukB-like Walker B domain-containing protein, partial [Ilyobacter sp.]|uniref:SbcC/MukB-like Walker B domain-containing protein n=1 Tax=Ilyobacter sp. TaxID=3100343 RepID=UPI00356A048A
RKEVELLEKDVKFLEDELSELEKIKSTLKRSLSLKEDELKKACEVRDGQIAWKMAKNLKEGESCPVCGSKEHPQVAEASEGVADDNIIESIEAEKKSIEQKLYKINLEKILSDLKSKKAQLKERNLSDMDSEIEKIKKESEDIKIKNDEIQRKKEELTGLKNKLITEKTLIIEKTANCQITIAELKESEKSKGSRRDLIKIELENTVPKYMSEGLCIEGLQKRLGEMKEMEKEQRNIKNELINIRKDISEKRKLVDDLKENIHVIESKSSGIKGSLGEKESQAELYRKEAEEKMEIFGFLSENEAEESFLSDDEMATLKGWIKEYQEKCEKNRISLENLDKKIAGRVVTESEWAISQNEKVAFENQKKELESKIVLLEKSIGDMEKLLKEVGDLKKESDRKKKELSLLEDLSKLFQGNAFVEYLAVSRLRSIVSNAARRLSRITNGKYSLAIDDSANFLVVDNFNGGEKRRSSTLSGGETFLVSLSLALALSNQIQLKGKSQLEFFFLDEGFGTLDSSLLERVINSLETLKNQEKLKVGIITHVDDIKERVPRKLQVYAAIPGERGTKVEMT